jgi:hypothetical protein
MGTEKLIFFSCAESIVVMLSSTVLHGVLGLAKHYAYFFRSFKC